MNRTPPFVPILAAALLSFVLLSPSGGGSPFAPAPTCRPGKVSHNYVVDVPAAYRQRNYGRSCVWSSTISMLRAMGDTRHADWLRRNRIGGAGPGSLNAAFRQMGVPYAYTVDGDVGLLDWALKHNRAVGIGYGAYHAQLLIGHSGGNAIILNNFSNGTKVYRVPWNEFLARWRRTPPEGGWAWVALPKGVVPPPEVPYYAGDISCEI
jgi:hypothetical protein